MICSASEPTGAELLELVRKKKVHSIVKPILAAQVRELLESFGATPGRDPAGVGRIGPHPLHAPGFPGGYGIPNQ